MIDNLVVEAILANNSMAAAHASISEVVGERRFKETAIRLGIHKPAKMTGRREKIPLADILAGMHPQYHSSTLRKRMIAEGARKHQCETCGHSEWNGRPIPLTLHHVDGNHCNNNDSNIQILCYNCHAQTENFGSLNKK